MKFLVLAAVAAVVVFAIEADAHAGHFHLYPDTPTGRNYIRRQVGSCSINSWVANSTSTMRVSGPAMLWLYLYKNCTTSVSSAVELDILVTDGGNPALNMSLMGYATTGQCSDNPMGGPVYLQNATNGTHPSNMIWFHEAATNATTGTLAGNAANSLLLRSMANGTMEADSVASFVLMDEDENRFACCEFDLVDKPSVEVLKAAPGAADCSSSSSSSNSTKPSNATTGSSSTGSTGSTAVGSGNATASSTRSAGTAATMSMLLLIAAPLAALLL